VLQVPNLAKLILLSEANDNTPAKSGQYFLQFMELSKGFDPFS